MPSEKIDAIDAIEIVDQAKKEILDICKKYDVGFCVEADFNIFIKKSFDGGFAAADIDDGETICQ